ncbi:cx9C motif-containing protein 4-like [Diadema setosum]|uniref:cx9C motif-containing protein 4-like n=1 Tax=Diadema setosum TaxID=31175 RepID=UPI003B3B722F
MPKGDPCQRQACDIQACLQAYKYNEAKCIHVIEAMRKCCDKFDSQQSVCCSGFLKTHGRHSRKGSESESSVKTS